MNFISFDAWNTLIVPNKTYANERTKLLMKLSNCRDEQFIKSLFDYTKSTIQHETVHKLKSYNPIQSIDKCKEVINHSLILKISEQSLTISEELNYIFRTHPPTILDSTKKTLLFLNHHNIKWGISSNTNFITGSIIHEVISKCIDIDIQDCIFSDMVGYVKPDPNFFNLIKERNVEHNIYHIGDDIECDIKGSINSNIIGVLCDRPELLQKRVDLVLSYF